MTFEFTLELDSGRIHYITGEVDFTKESDPINIVCVKFEEGEEEGEEMSDAELRSLWHQIMQKVEMYLHARQIHEGRAFIN